MKNYFLVNPNAGKGKNEKIVSAIKSVCDSNPNEFEFYLAANPGDSRAYTKKIAESGEEARVYACGGDGTLYEVINGAVGYKNISVGVVPLGSGNDFVRLFGTKEQFYDIDAQINGKSVPLDLINCSGKYAISQCSMGMDAEVCAKQATFKKMPIFSGESAYTASLVYCVFTKSSNTFTITIDDGKPQTVDVLFALCGNSKYYGGGYKGAPLAMPNDGLLDFVIVKKDMPILKFLGLMNDYKAGKHLEWDRTMLVRGKKMTIHSDKPAAVNVDGECDYVNDSTFEIVPSAINFIVPSVFDFEKLNEKWIEENKSCKNVFTSAI